MENDDWKPTYNSLSGQPKHDVHNSLIAEQGYVCAYCGRSLKDDRTDSHIDHFWPQSDFGPGNVDDRSLNYDNFHASCGPASLPMAPNNLPFTCGQAKDDWYDLEHFIQPRDPGCERRFRYGASGNISATAEDDLAAKNMIKALALANASLAYERSVVLKEIESAIYGKEDDRQILQAEIDLWRSPIDWRGQLRGFGHVAARYLELEFT